MSELLCAGIRDKVASQTQLLKFGVRLIILEVGVQFVILRVLKAPNSVIFTTVTWCNKSCKF